MGDVANYSGNEEKVRQRRMHVDILEDSDGIAFFAKYPKEKPDQCLEDAYGLAAVRKAAKVET